MLLISALRFTLVDSSSVHDTIVDCYFLFLGLVVGLSQLNIRAITSKFRFLNYHWGKLLLSFFLACMSFSSGNEDKEVAFVQYIVSVYFLMVSFLFLVLTVIDSDRDSKQYQIDKLDILNSPLLKI